MSKAKKKEKFIDELVAKRDEKELRKEVIAEHIKKLIERQEFIASRAQLQE